MTAKEGADRVRRGEWRGYIPAAIWAELSAEDIQDLLKQRREVWEKAFAGPEVQVVWKPSASMMIVALIVLGLLALAVWGIIALVR